MQVQAFEHRGRSVEIPAQNVAKRMRLKIDGRNHVFGRDAAGEFFLHNYAYDRSKDLTQVIKNYLDHDEDGHNSSATPDRSK